MISKKDLLKKMDISYGQLYRWKREGLIPDEWFIKQSVSTGQETYFKETLIIPRIEKILELKDLYQLEELRKIFEPQLENRSITLQEAVLLDDIDPIVLKIYAKKHNVFNIAELAMLKIFSKYNEYLDLILYLDLNLHEINSSSIIYIVKHAEDYFLLISSGEMLLDPKLTLIEKIHLEDIIKEIAKELR